MEETVQAKSGLRRIGVVLLVVGTVTGIILGNVISLGFISTALPPTGWLCRQLNVAGARHDPVDCPHFHCLCAPLISA